MRSFGTCMIPASVKKTCSEANPLYDTDLDLDGDGWVDGDEISLLLSLLGWCWDGESWNLGACQEPRK